MGQDADDDDVGDEGGDDGLLDLVVGGDEHDNSRFFLRVAL